MMKKKCVLCIVAGLLSMSAFAQMIPTSRQECNRRCVRHDFPENPKTLRYQEKMTSLEEKKKSETDAAKRQEIEKEMAGENEKRADFLDRLCEKICRDNPEQ